MSRLWIVFVVLVALILAFAFREKATNFPVKKVEESPIIESPVLVELFTSQGCSSCPPADAVLAKLAGENERGESSAITLSYHVDYWNRLGWRDPYSQASFSDRQRQYAQKLQDSRVYTPQIIVQGKSGHVGSREREIRTAIDKAAVEDLSTKINGTIANDTLNYTLEGKTSGLILNIAIVEKETQNNVPRGENSGRNLEHVQVVRWLKTIAHPDVIGTLSLPPEFDLSTSDYSLVIFTQFSDSWQLTGLFVNANY